MDTGVRVFDTTSMRVITLVDRPAARCAGRDGCVRRTSFCCSVLFQPPLFASFMPPPPLPIHSPRADLYRCHLAWRDDPTLLMGWADCINVRGAGWAWVWGDGLLCLCLLDRVSFSLP